MEQLHTELKTLIIDVLNLEDITVEDIDTDAPLFNDGLGLDSIDALELGLAIKKTYNIVIDADDTITVNTSHQSLTLLIISHRTKRNYYDSN